jgi:hypothetical protein
MAQVIIYPNDEGWLSVVIPAPECGIPIEEIARKDVHPGKPYHIIDSSLLANIQIVKASLDDLYTGYCNDENRIKDLGYIAVPTQRHSHQLSLIFKETVAPILVDENLVRNIMS